MAELTDFLALGPELIERLQSRLDKGVHVLGAADLAGVTEERQLTPAVHVVFHRYRLMESKNGAKVNRVQQTWLAVVATRNVRALATGQQARFEAGQLSAEVLKAFVGWQPKSATAPLALTDGPAAKYTAGAQYLPLAFTTELVVKASI